MNDYTAARRHMIDSQIRPNRVSDRNVVGAFAEVAREEFVPADLRGIAYVDEDIAIGDGRYLMEPMVLARLLQEAGPRPQDDSLAIGCGTGYSVAILARLCSTVVGIESNAELVEVANANLMRLGIDNAAVVAGNLTAGCPEQGPYDLILFDGAVAEVPRPILDQLTPDGRLVAVIDDGSAPIGRATLFLNSDGAIARRPLFDAAIKTLPGYEKVPGFVF